MVSQITICTHCSCKSFTNMCCHHRRSREAKTFSWPSVEAALLIFNVVRFCIKKMSEEELIKTKEIFVKAEPKIF